MRALLISLNARLPPLA